MLHIAGGVLLGLVLFSLLPQLIDTAAALFIVVLIAALGLIAYLAGGGVALAIVCVLALGLVILLALGKRQRKERWKIEQLAERLPSPSDGDWYDAKIIAAAARKREAMWIDYVACAIERSIFSRNPPPPRTVERLGISREDLIAAVTKEHAARAEHIRRQTVRLPRHAEQIERLSSDAIFVKGPKCRPRVAEAALSIHKASRARIRKTAANLYAARDPARDQSGHLRPRDLAYLYWPPHG
jgi:hypothetical protein